MLLVSVPAVNKALLDFVPSFQSLCPLRRILIWRVALYRGYLLRCAGGQRMKTCNWETIEEFQPVYGLLFRACLGAGGMLDGGDVVVSVVTSQEEDQI